MQLPACDGAEDVAVLQVGQQLQVAGLLFRGNGEGVGGGDGGKKIKNK